MYLLDYMYFLSVSIPHQEFFDFLENVYILPLFANFRYILRVIILERFFNLRFILSSKHMVLVLYSLSAIMT